jgi:hypothetical protein
MKIGFIGLGNMGGPMALNLMKAGHELLVHDVRRETAAVHLGKGARWAASPRDAAVDRELILTSLPGPAEVERVATGADGVILWQQDGDKFPLRIFNQDGSEAECSGNGLRCMAAYLFQSDRWSEDEIRLETISGVYRLRRVGQEYEADMGEPKLAPRDIPFIAPTPMDRVVNHSLRADGQAFAITACSTGNSSRAAR